MSRRLPSNPPATVEVLRTLAMTLAVLAKSSNDPDLRIAASEEEKEIRERIHDLERLIPAA